MSVRDRGAGPSPSPDLLDPVSQLDYNDDNDAENAAPSSPTASSAGVDIKVVHASAGRRFQFTQRSASKPRPTKASEAMAVARCVYICLNEQLSEDFVI